MAGLKDASLVEVFKEAGSIVSITVMPLSTFKALMGDTLTGMSYQLLCISAVLDKMVDRMLAKNIDTVCQ